MAGGALRLSSASLKKRLCREALACSEMGSGALVQCRACAFGEFFGLIEFQLRCIVVVVFVVAISSSLIRRLFLLLLPCSRVQTPRARSSTSHGPFVGVSSALGPFWDRFWPPHGPRRRTEAADSHPPRGFLSLARLAQRWHSKPEYARTG